MKAIILARVSTEEQKEEGHSIPAQLEKARQYCFRKGLEIRSEHQFDESSLKDVRIKFEKIVDEIKASNEKVALIVETIDRLQRSFKESVLLDQFRKEGRLEIHFLRENLIIRKESNSSEIRRWDLGVFLAKSYVLQITDNVNRSIEQKLRNGEFPGRPPFGYNNVRDEQDKSKIELHPFKSKVVHKIFEWYATDAYSITEIHDKVKKDFHLKLFRSRIEAILKHPFYYGEMRYRGQIYPHKHPTIVSKQLFDHVQGIFAGRNKKPFKYKGLSFLYRGLIRCKECDCAITPIRKTKKSGRKYVYYHCTQRRHKHTFSYVREENLTKQFTELFDKIHIPDKIVKEVLQALRSTHAAKKNYHETVLKALQDEYDKLQRRLEMMYEDKLDGVITEEEFEARSTRYRIEQKSIEHKIKNLRGTDENYFRAANYILNLANKAPQIFKSSDIEIKRQLIKLVCRNPVLNDATVSTAIRKPFNEFVKGPSCPVWRPQRDLNTCSLRSQVRSAYGLTPVASLQNQIRGTLARRAPHQ